MLTSCIHDIDLDSNGVETARFRLELQYEDSKGVLETIAGASTPIDEIPDATVSIEHLKIAYQTVRTFLREHFDGNAGAIKQFFGAFMNRVKLIRIVTPRLSHALKVFETINDRGVGLTAVDLLKNLLFIQTTERNHPKLKNLWKDFINRLEKVKEKPLRFLRYFVMSEYEGDWNKPLRAEQIYDWFRKNTSRCKIDSDPIGFVNLLKQRAGVYENYLKGNDPYGNPSHSLQNIGIVAGRGARQHMIILLAGAHLTSEGFNKLAKAVESLFFCFIVTKESTKTLERWFGTWATQLRSVEAEDDLDQFIEEHLYKAIREREKTFDFAIRELTFRRIQKYNLKYVLAKLTQHIEQEAWGNPAYESLTLYVNKKIEIEHILPQNPKPEVRAEFDKPEEYDDFKQKLGNLTLLEKVINSANSNRPFEDKIEGYGQSKMLLTRSLFEKPSVGKNSSLNHAVEILPEFEGWDSEAIDQRQESLLELARKVWIEDALG